MTLATPPFDLRGALLLVVALDQIDNQVMRFLSTHFDAGLVETFGRVQAWGGDMVAVFATDQGGTWPPSTSWP